MKMALTEHKPNAQVDGAVVAGAPAVCAKCSEAAGPDGGLCAACSVKPAAPVGGEGGMGVCPGADCNEAAKPGR